MTIKPATESNMRDIKAGIALRIADAVSIGRSLRAQSERLEAVKGVLRVEDDDEARSLIARGRRLARKRVQV